MQIAGPSARGGYWRIDACPVFPSFVLVVRPISLRASLRNLSTDR
ncbi:hypothetical protein [Rosistilla oblonga]